jgi:hypothetical protein
MMKQGKTVIQLCTELERQRLARKDFIADTRNLEVETINGITRLSLLVGETSETFLLNDLAHRQMADRLQIPYRYYERMRYEYPRLLDDNVNSWFNKTPEQRMIRTLDGNARAFLSNRYRRLDNLELADSILPIIKEMRGAEVISCDITESHMYLKIINKALKAEVQPNDIVQAGIVISNSEVGLGSLRVEPLIYRLICKNGLIAQDYAQRRYHVGKQIENDDSAYEIFRDETIEADDKAFFMKVQDTVRTTIDEAIFQVSVDKLKRSMFETTGNDPVKAVEVLADKYLLSQNERGSVLRHFIIGADLTKYGLINAVTRASQDIEDYNRATTLERLGGELLNVPSTNKALFTGTHMISSEKNITNVIPLGVA